MNHLIEPIDNEEMEYDAFFRKKGKRRKRRKSKVRKRRGSIHSSVRKKQSVNRSKLNLKRSVRQRKPVARLRMPLASKHKIVAKKRMTKPIKRINPIRKTIVSKKAKVPTKVVIPTSIAPRRRKHNPSRNISTRNMPVPEINIPKMEDKSFKMNWKVVGGLVLLGGIGYVAVTKQKNKLKTKGIFYGHTSKGYRK